MTIIYRRSIEGTGCFKKGDRVRVAPHSDWFMRGATHATIVGFGNSSQPNKDGYHTPFARVILSNGLGDMTPRKRRWLSLDDILRPGDVPEGGSADSYYSRGIAVYK